MRNLKMCYLKMRYLKMRFISKFIYLGIYILDKMEFFSEPKKEPIIYSKKCGFMTIKIILEPIIVLLMEQSVLLVYIFC